LKNGLETRIMGQRMKRRIGRGLLALAAFGFGYLIYLYLTLPDVRSLRTQNPATTAFIELRLREARAEGRAPRRVQQWMPYNRISPNIKRAVLVAEDAGFWGHEGIDLVEIRKSLETDWEKGTFFRGASTITQQLAKNLYLSPSRNPFRKLRELIITRRLEHELSKTRIFELYLNEIEWGDGIYGADAAARSYFGESASSVNPDQAALMAGAIVNPRLLTIAHPTARLRSRQRIIRARMGNVTPPPVIATPLEPGTAPEPGSATDLPPDDLPTAPPEEAPPAMPSAPEPPAKPPAQPPAPQPFPGAGQP
jgi:monofunctional biosynthetic peptidoglycan transglycosylase